MKEIFSRINLILWFVFSLAAVSASAQETQTFECPDSILVGAKNLPGGWLPGFGDKRLVFEEAAASGQTMNCSYGATLESSFVLQRQFPGGFVCRVDQLTNKPRLNRKFICTRVKPPIKIPKKN